MGGFFKGAFDTKVQQPAPVSLPPTPTDPAVIERRRRMRKQRRLGRQDSILTGPRGLVSRGTISAPTLLGSTQAP